MQWIKHLFFVVTIPLTITGSLLMLRCLNFKPDRIQLLINKKWPHLNKHILRVIHILSIFVILLPYALSIVYGYSLWSFPYKRAHFLSIGINIFFSTIYSMIMGYLSWKNSLWTFTLFVKCTFGILLALLFGFLIAFDYLNSTNSYEVSSILFLMTSSVPMILIIYRQITYSAINLNHLYIQFLNYYENKLKSQTHEDVKIEVQNASSLISSMQNLKSESLENEEKGGNIEGEYQFGGLSDLKLIDMSRILSKISMNSSE